MYTQQRGNVHEKYHDRIKTAVTQDKPLAIKIDLTSPGDDVILMTPGQLIKIERALREGKKVLTIRLSRKQVRSNLKFEEGSYLHFWEWLQDSSHNCLVDWLRERCQAPLRKLCQDRDCS